MIVSLRCENFRCFRDSGTLELAPLTLIVGQNNSGKSSLLQALHLPALTLQSEDRAICLKLVHPDYDYGTFSDLVFRHEDKCFMTLSFGIQPELIGGRKKRSRTQATLKLTYGYMPVRRQIYLSRFVIEDDKGERLNISRNKYDDTKKVLMRGYEKYSEIFLDWSYAEGPSSGHASTQ